MAEGIIMVNERTTLRLLSRSLLCFRGRLTRLVSRSEPLARARACMRARRESHTHDTRAGISFVRRSLSKHIAHSEIITYSIV